MRNKKISLLIVFILLASMLLTACQSEAEKPTIRIGSKEFTEQYILGNMYALLLEDAGFKATYNSIGGSTEVHNALLEDQIDLYPEYTGTALMTHLQHEFDNTKSRDEIYQLVKSDYAEKWDLTWLEPTQFNNTYCITLTQEKAAELNVKTLSDLSAKADQLVFGTEPEFTERADGIPGLQETYGGFNFKEVRSMDAGLMYSGLADGSIDVTTCFGTDGQISAYNLVVLEDDKNFWPPYAISPVVRDDVLKEYPEIATILNPLSALLDDATMSRLNWEVAGNSQEPDEVAAKFLKDNGLID